MRTVGMRCRHRVGMPTDYLPPHRSGDEMSSALAGERQQLGAAGHCGLPVLVFEEGDEIGTGVARDFVGLDGCAIAEVR